MINTVFAVHAVMVDEVRPTQALFRHEPGALSYAAEVSNDPDVLAAGVTQFGLDELGTRRNVAMFVRGKRQAVPHLSDCRTIHGGGRSHF